jgi:uncharacterized membrane protein
MSRIVVFAGCLAGFIFTASPASAFLKVCNMTSSRVGIAIGYKDPKGWVSEGWWNIASHNCEVLLKDDLIARYYYVHALDYDRDDTWPGKSTMCTKDKKFKIRGAKDCEKRGYKSSKFFEVDTNNERDWKVKLTEEGATGQ